MNIIMAEIRNQELKSKQLRRSGIIPCVISGADMKESLLIQIPESTARQLKRCKRDGSKIDIKVNNQVYHTLIKDLEYNNLTDSVVHICFHVLDADKKVNSVADIVLINKDKVQGILEQMQVQVPHAAIPENLLDIVTIDLSEVSVGTTLTIGDIPEFQSDNIELQADPESIVLRIKDKKRIDDRQS